MGFQWNQLLDTFIALVTVPVTTFFISPGEFGKAEYVYSSTNIDGFNYLSGD
ncbi:hypothetical protein ACQVGZ_09025 [Enterococcus lactis]